MGSANMDSGAFCINPQESERSCGQYFDCQPNTRETEYQIQGSAAVLVVPMEKTQEEQTSEGDYTTVDEDT